MYIYIHTYIYIHIYKYINKYKMCIYIFIIIFMSSRIYRHMHMYMCMSLDVLILFPRLLRPGSESTKRPSTGVGPPADQELPWGSFKGSIRVPLRGSFKGSIGFRV